MKQSLYTVGEIHRLGLLMGRGGAYKDKVAVLRQVKKMKHTIVMRHGQRHYAVPLSEIIKHNQKKQRRVKIPLLEERRDPRDK